MLWLTCENIEFWGNAKGFGATFFDAQIQGHSFISIEGCDQLLLAVEGRVQRGGQLMLGVEWRVSILMDVGICDTGPNRSCHPRDEFHRR